MDRIRSGETKSERRNVMAWFLLLALFALLVYGYFTGRIKYISEESRQKHEIILNMWLDGLKALEVKKVYGDETDRIVTMMRHGIEQMAFDLCGYETMVKMDDKQRMLDTPPSTVKASVGRKKKEVHHPIVEKNESTEKRLKEVFNGNVSE